MKGFFKGIISNTKSLGEKIENTTLIIDKTWLLVNEIESFDKITYIFRSKNEELLVSSNGIVNKGKWEYIKTSNCFLIDYEGITKLFNIILVRENYLIIKNDANVQPLIFVNESFYQNKYSKLSGKIFDSVLADIKGNKITDVINIEPTLLTVTAFENNETEKRLEKDKEHQARLADLKRIEVKPNFDYSKSNTEIKNTMQKLEDLKKEMDKNRGK